MTELIIPIAKSRRRYRWLALLVLIVALAGGLKLGIHSLFLRFPALEPGSYIGSIRGLALGSEQRSTQAVLLYVERSIDNNEFLFTVFSQGYDPQRAIGIPARTITGQPSFLPLAISGAGKSLTFPGEQITSHTFRGFVDSANGRGEWTLSQIGGEEPRRTLSEESELRLWLMLRSELGDVELRERQLSEVIPSQREEIKRLTAFVTQGDQLRKRAQDKFATIQDELAKAQAQFKLRQQEAQQLERSVQISQKVKGIGKLAELSRETLEREGRWIDSMSRSASDSLKAEIEVELERAKRILAVRDEVEVELAKIKALREPEIPSPQPSSEDVQDTEGGDEAE